jgi:hypothetical protein
LELPRGHRAWTEEGLALLDEQARPLAECRPDESCRGLLALPLLEYRHLLELLQQLVDADADHGEGNPC